MGDHDLEARLPLCLQILSPALSEERIIVVNMATRTHVN
jgi:hypothetical protein